MPLEVNPGPMNWGAEGVQISGEGKGTNARLRLSDCGALPPLVLTQAREDIPMQTRKLKLNHLLMVTARKVGKLSGKRGKPE